MLNKYRVLYGSIKKRQLFHVQRASAFCVNQINAMASGYNLYSFSRYIDIFL